MILKEFFETEPDEYQDLQNDNSQVTLTDTRKSKLTLAQLRQLRRLNDIKMVEYQEKLEKVKRQYAPAPDA